MVVVMNGVAVPSLGQVLPCEMIAFRARGEGKAVSGRLSPVRNGLFSEGGPVSAIGLDRCLSRYGLTCAGSGMVREGRLHRPVLSPTDPMIRGRTNPNGKQRAI